MKNIFEQKFTRRNFINASAKVLAAYSTLGLFAETVEAKRKKKSPAPEPEEILKPPEKFWR